jgi:hypothetical protein
MCVHVIPHICPDLGNPGIIPTVKKPCYCTSMANRRKHPQLSATVSVETYELLRSASLAIGQSMSSVVSELLEAASPHLRIVVQAHAVAKESRDELPFVMQGILNDAGKQLVEAQAEMSEVWNQVRRQRPSK